MVAIISGSGPGLNLAPLASPAGSALAGARGGPPRPDLYVQAGTGNLVIQQRDEYLASRGEDAAALRTYNSQGRFADDNGDNWLLGSWLQPIARDGELNAAGSTLVRTERDGSQARYRYDVQLALYVTTDGDGAHDTITWLAGERQLEWRDGSTGTVERYEGEGECRLLARRDPSGNALSFCYDELGRLNSVISASGDVTWYDYAGTGQRLARIRVAGADGLDRTRQWYGYDAQGRLAHVAVDMSPEDGSIADGHVHSTSYGYHGDSKRVATIGQADGSVTHISYVDPGDGVYRVNTIVDPLGRTTTFFYGNTADGGSTTQVIDPAGIATRYETDASGRLVAVVAPGDSALAPTRRFTYTPDGDIATATDAAGRTTVFEYDARGNQVLQRDAAGNTVRRSHDAHNQLLSETAYTVADPDAAGAAQPSGALTTRHVYDAAGRNLLRFSISAEGRVTEHRYNGFGERTSTVAYAQAIYTGTAPAPTEADLATWAAGQPAAGVQRTDMSYDARGQLLTRTTYAKVSATGEGVLDGTQAVERFVRDAAGRLLTTVSPRGGSTVCTYDTLDRVLTSTDAAGNVTRSAYDDVGRRTIVTASNGLVSTRAYDAAGRLVAVVESNGAGAALGETRYFHDASDRLRMTTDPTGVRAWLLYDAAGRTAGEVDGNGTLTETRYDAAGRPVLQITFATPVDVARLADGTNQPRLDATLAAIRVPEGPADRRLLRSYDAAGRLVLEAKAVGAGAQAAVTETVYDGASRVVAVVAYANPVAFPVGATTVQKPASSGDDRVTRFFHDADGLLRGRLDGEGYLTAFQYDGAGRATEQTRYARPTTASLRAAGTLAQLLPAASADDRRELTFRDGRGLEVGRVDAEGYLTETAYDADGNATAVIRYANRTAAGLTANTPMDNVRPAIHAGDRVTTRTYDALGRVTRETTPDAVVTAFAYDARGNLVSTIRALGSTEARSLLARHDLQGRLTGELSAQGAALLTGGQTQAEIDLVWLQHGTKHAYDAAGRRTSSTDALGQRTLFFYNADDALTFTVNPAGEVSETRYDTLGRASEEIRYATRVNPASLSGGVAPLLPPGSAADSRVTLAYHADGTVARRTDALGHATTHGYNAFGEETLSMQAGTGLAVTHAYDHRGLHTQQVSDPGAIHALTSTAYDAFGRAIRSVDANGGIREESFDRLGRTVTRKDAGQALRRTSYDAFDRVLTQTDALGNVSTYSYDVAARAMTVTTAEGVLTRTTYSRHGQVISVQDGRGIVTSYSYDRNGNLLQTSTPVATTRQAYDSANRLVETTDGRGTRIVYTYDAAGRVLTRKVDPAGLNLTTTFGYDASGRQVAMTDATGVVTTTEFDRGGQVTRQVVDPGGLALQTVYAYDPAGNVLGVTAPDGAFTQYFYDRLGRRIQERVDPAGLDIVRSWTYDDNGNAVTATDALGHLTRHAYDAENRLVFTVDPLGQVTHNGYDAEGRVIRSTRYATAIALGDLASAPSVAAVQGRVSQEPTQDRVEHRVFDRDGGLVATVDGTGSVVCFLLDGNGNVVTRIGYAARLDMATWQPGTLPNPPATSTDSRMTSVFDAANRRVYSIDGTGSVVKQEYDANGNVIRTVAYATAIGQAADPATVPASDRDRVNAMVYDSANRLVLQVDPLNVVTAHTLDAAGRVIARTTHANPIAAIPALGTLGTSAALRAALRPDVAADRTTFFGYDAAGRLQVQVDAAGSVTETQYDVAGRVVARIARATVVDTTPLDATPSLATLRALVQFHADDRITRTVYDAAGREVYGIDAAGSVRQLVFDGAGRVVRTIRSARQVTLQTAATAGAIANAVGTHPDDRVETFRYDAVGRLVGSTDALGFAEGFEFDALGNKVRFIDKLGSVWTYTHDRSGRLLTEVSPEVAIVSRPPATATNAADIGSAVAGSEVLARLTTRFSYDALGNLTQRTEAAGRPEERSTGYAYDAAGRQVRVVHPRVAVYDAANDALPTHGVAPRVELQKDLQTQTFYNALGDAVAGLDLAGHLSQKTYDRAGRLQYEVDAMGHVTAYGRNAFGEQTVLLRYAARSSLANRAVTQAAHAVSGADVQAALAAPGFSHAGSRLLESGYDRAGRLVEVQEPLVQVNAQSAAGVDSTTSARKRTVHRYDAFGGRTQTLEAAGLGDRFALTQRVFDRMGRETATVDALGYVTQRTFDAMGNQTGLREYATSIGPAAAYRLPGVADTDRTWSFTYDKADRKLAETRHGVSFSAQPDGTLAAGKEIRTSHAYDALGRQVRLTAADGAVTETFHDALGRVRAVATPPHGGIGGSTRPFTLNRHDAFGRLVATQALAGGMPADWTTRVNSLGGAAEDRTHLAEFDALDRTIRTTAANGAHTFYSYEAAGRLAKKWQAVTDDVATRTTFEQNHYDALGRLLEVRTPNHSGGFSSTRMDYNAFGELTGRGDGAVLQEFFDYDQAGRLWRTNSGDGVTRIQLFDVQGNVTAELRSGGAGHHDRNLLAIDAATAQVDPTLRRTDIRYDLLGRMTSRLEPARVEDVKGVSVRDMYVGAYLVTTPPDQASPGGSARTSLTLTWTPLDHLGSGDVKVVVEYRTQSGTIKAFHSPLFLAHEAASSVALGWPDPITVTESGHALADQAIEVTRVVIYKKNVNGTFVAVADQPPGFGIPSIDVPAPADPMGGVVLQVRAANQPEGVGWWSAPLNIFGEQCRFDATGLAPGSYEYRVTLHDMTVGPWQVAAGTLSVTARPLQVIPASLTYGLVAPGILAWTQHSAANNRQVFRYRAVGSTGEWQVGPIGAYGLNHGVDTRGLAVGSYEFELLWTPPYHESPNAHATGTFHVVAGTPPTWVPPVNLPHLDLQLAGPGVAWSAPVTSLAQYRAAGGAWINLALTRPGDGLTYGELNHLPPGSYEVRVQVGNPPTAQATGVFSTGMWMGELPPVASLYLTTPPYLPGHFTQGTPRQYHVATTTGAGSPAISTTLGATTVGHAPGQDGAQRAQRPVVMQATDRWGNVISRSDPRAPAWITTYAYNHDNHLAQQSLPDTGDGPAVTQLYHDPMGRQVAVRDANGNVQGKRFDAAGNLVEEIHAGANAGTVRHSYDAFGQKVRTVDAESRAQGFSYDKAGNLVSMAKGMAFRYGATTHVESSTLLDFGFSQITERWTYDQLGRKLSHTNGNDETTRYRYDLRGNVVQSFLPLDYALGRSTRSVFDAQGRKVAETDANNNTATWSYDYFGLLLHRTDLGGVRYDFQYDHARQLVRQTNGHGQDLRYTFDAAGQVASIADATGKTSSYAYDLAGRRVREKVVKGGAVYQDNHLAYDARGQLRAATDARVYMAIDYDKAGNRTHIHNAVDYQGRTQEIRSDTHRYFRYDAMNRQVVVDAVDAAGNIGTQGHRIAYDRNGNRTQDTWWGKRVEAMQSITDFNADGTASFSAPIVYYQVSDGEVTESYRYDALNRLVSVIRDGEQIDVRFYDGADRVIQSGPARDLSAQFTELSNQGLAPGESNGKERRLSRYDANGRLQTQVVKTSEGHIKSQAAWDATQSIGGYAGKGYDAAGNSLGYVVHQRGTAVNQYTTASTRLFDAYREETTTSVSTKLAPGSSTQHYDANGMLVRVTDSTQPLNNRDFVNDVEGRALFVKQGANVQRQFIVNGEVLGIYGVGVDPMRPSSGGNNNPNFADIVDFNFGYARISGSYPSPAPGSYQVRSGDTLQSIARGAYGDGALWYRIADANGLASSNDLKIGQSLTIPNRPGTIHNNSGTFKPYDPSRIEGDKTPNMAMPENGGGCGGAGKLLMVIVAVVVTAFVGPSLLAAVLSSVASQAVGLATGTIDRFSWKSIALSAAGAGIANGLSGSFSNLGNFAPVAEAVTANAAYQGLGVVTGLQDKFDWRGVAGAGVGAAVGTATSAALASNGVGNAFSRGVIAGTARGFTSAIVRGGKVDSTQIVVDAFGNALGSSLEDAATGTPEAQPDTLADFIKEKLAEQERRDLYGIAGAGGPLGLRLGGGAGLRPTESTVAGWSAATDLRIAATAQNHSTAERMGLPADSFIGGRAHSSFPHPARELLGRLTGFYDGEFDRGDGWAMTQVSRMNPSGYRSGSLIELGRNRGRENIMNGVNETLGYAGLTGDYRVIGNATVLAAQAGRMTTELAGIRKDLIALGKKPPMEADMYAPGEGFRLLADKLEEHRNFVRLTVFERAGVLTLNDDMSIRTIGKSQMTPQAFVVETGRQYQLEYSNAVAEAKIQFESGKIPAWMAPLKGTLPDNMLVGFMADQASQSRLRINWLRSEGVPEFGGSIAQINRNLYDPQGSGNYTRPDVYIDLGPRDRYIFDGSVGFKAPTTPQMRDFARHAYGASFDDYSRIMVIRQNAEDSYRPFLRYKPGFTVPGRR